MRILAIVILLLAADTAAPAYWHTANLCHAIVKAETAVVITSWKAGSLVKRCVRRVFRKHKTQ